VVTGPAGPVGSLGEGATPDPSPAAAGTQVPGAQVPLTGSVATPQVAGDSRLIVAARLVPPVIWAAVLGLGGMPWMAFALQVLAFGTSWVAAFSGDPIQLGAVWMATLYACGCIVRDLVGCVGPWVAAVMGSPHLGTICAYGVALALFALTARFGGGGRPLAWPTLAGCVAPTRPLHQHGDHGREARMGRQVGAGQGSVAPVPAVE
jgi:hypothetical protein